MTKILFITNHPSPYMNRWFEGLEVKYKVGVLYYYHKAIYKQWKSFKPYTGEYLVDVNIMNLVKKILGNDFVIICGLDKPKYMFSLLLLVIFRKKFAIYSDYPTNEKGKFSLIKKITYKHLVSFIFCATDSTAKYYKDKYRLNENKLRIFPYAHNYQSFFPKEYNKERKLHIEAGNKIKLFIANSFYKRKGYSTLYKSFMELKLNKLLEIFDITITGTGDDFNYYNKRFSELSPNIKMLGWVEDEEYNEHMRKTDIFLHPSLIEPFGIPPLDAMENGKLLISSDGVKSVDAIVVNGKNGYLFTAGKSSELTDILLNIIKNRDNIYRIGENAYHSVLLHYPKDKIIKTLESCLLI